VNEFIALISSGEGENKRSALSVSIERKSSSNERMACLISEFGSFKVANMIAKGRISSRKGKKRAFSVEITSYRDH